MCLCCGVYERFLRASWFPIGASQAATIAKPNYPLRRVLICLHHRVELNETNPTVTSALSYLFSSLRYRGFKIWEISPRQALWHKTAFGRYLANPWSDPKSGTTSSNRLNELNKTIGVGARQFCAKNGNGRILVIALGLVETFKCM